MTASAGASAPGKELAGKVALVTGGGRNIGAAISRALADAGAAVAINTRASREDADKVAQEIRAAGGQAEVYLADIADARQVNAMVESAVKRFGRLDILVLNASVRTEKPFLDLTYEEWRVPLSITLDGAFFCTKACAPHMVKAGGGSIVTLGGLQALSGSKSRVHGSVAKSGLIGFTRALSRDLAQYGIRVNCVAPGHIETIRAAHRSARDDQKKIIPLGRFGEPREIADTVRFLAGPGASFITGQTVHVNGGQTNF
jgi:3-oxoacyl-[acyl-carrier protein] reductase